MAKGVKPVKRRLTSLARCPVGGGERVERVERWSVGGGHSDSGLVSGLVPWKRSSLVDGSGRQWTGRKGRR